MSDSVSVALRQNTHRPSIQEGVRLSRNRLSDNSSVSELSQQLRAANLYALESGFIGTEDRSHSQISLGIRNSLNSGTDASCSLSYEKELDEIMEADDVSEDQLSDDQFILEFAKRCAKYPGRKPLLLDIEKVIPRSQRSRLPIILVILRSISLVTESSI